MGARGEEPPAAVFVRRGIRRPVSVKASLRLCVESPGMSLEDATWQVANTRRERGRIVRNRSVGSTLLVKGLEFDHVAITPDACCTKLEWYVALTRATRSVRVFAPHQS